jgi:hypothetical protein
MISADELDFKRVKAVAIVLRLDNKRVSALNIIKHLQLDDVGMRKSEVCAHLRRLRVEEMREPISSTAGTDYASPNSMLRAFGSLDYSAANTGTSWELSGTTPEPILSTPGTTPEQTGTLRTDLNSKPTKYTGGEPHASPPLHARRNVTQKIEKPSFPEHIFEPEDEQRVKHLLSRRYKSGKALPEKIAQFRHQAWEDKAAFGLVSWRYAVDDALSREPEVSDPMKYAKGILRKHKDDEVPLGTVAPSRVEPSSYKPESSKPNAYVPSQRASRTPSGGNKYATYFTPEEQAQMDAERERKFEAYKSSGEMQRALDALDALKVSTKTPMGAR